MRPARSAACLAITAVMSLLLGMRPAAAQPEARFETNFGNFTILLEPDKAPATVANFIRYTKEGHFNGTVFYRIVPDFVIQAGSFGADGKWRALHKPIALETSLSNTRGSIAMAREEKPVSALAEFFINLSDSNAKALDAKPGAAPNTTGYAVFGHVTSGMEVVDAIAAAPIGGGVGPFPENYPQKPVIIRKVTIGVAPPAAVVPPAADAPAATPEGVAPPAAAPAQSGQPPQQAPQ
ncbi:MAG: peptidylprolyl isomerase [Rhizomicrobium sp.]|nr:peptidylprolyl isomerase [Rhizomicrobium sp.]